MDISSVFPWNLFVGLNVFCGIALAAGGCTVAATIHILNGEGYRPVVRPSLVVGFLGYLIAFLGFISDQNLALRIASHMTVWSVRSIRYGVFGVLILFGVVVVLDFAPELSKYLRWRNLPNAICFLSLPALFLALIFSVLSQSTLIDVLQAASSKVSPLWSSPQLPFLFFISAACGALAAVIFASWHTSIAFGRGVPTNLVASMGKRWQHYCFSTYACVSPIFSIEGFPCSCRRTTP